MRQLNLFGLNLVNADRDSVLTSIGQTPVGAGRKIYFANAHCLNLAMGGRAYSRAMQRADMILPDGSGIALAARYQGSRLRENLNGTDLFQPLLKLFEQKGWSVYLLGGRVGVGEAVRARMAREYPDLPVVGVDHGFVPESKHAALVQRIAASGADVLLTAMGVPKQELWIDRHIADTGVRMAFALGACFDFYAGQVPRAPKLLRRNGLEWTYRLWIEPARMWRRYILGNPAFVWSMLRKRRIA